MFLPSRFINYINIKISKFLWFWNRSDIWKFNIRIIRSHKFHKDQNFLIFMILKPQRYLKKLIILITNLLKFIESNFFYLSKWRKYQTLNFINNQYLSESFIRVDFLHMISRDLNSTLKKNEKTFVFLFFKNQLKKSYGANQLVFFFNRRKCICLMKRNR